MRLLTRLVFLSFAAIALAAVHDYSQELPTYPINPKVLPRFPDNPVSNIPKAERVQLGNDAPGVVPPVAFAIALPPMRKECKGAKDASSVALTLVVDSEGEPRNVMFKRALGSELDMLALKILLEARFKPAALNGSPVAFGRDVQIDLKACTERQAGAAGEVTRLRVAPELTYTDWHGAAGEANLAPFPMLADAIGDGERPGADGFVLPKSIAHQVYNPMGMSGSFQFGVLVDEHGIGHIEKVLKSTNPALLPVAAAMIRSARYTPAMKDGMPVPFHMTEGLDLQY